MPARSLFMALVAWCFAQPLAACDPSAPLATRDEVATPADQGSPTTPRATAPDVILVATRPDADSSELYRVSPGSELGAPFASVAHPRGAAVRAATALDGETVFVVADERAVGDLSYAGALFSVRPDQPAIRLASDVSHASRPVPTKAGVAFVTGEAGDTEPRVDRLALESVSADGADRRRVFEVSGLFLSAIGCDGERVVAYVVPTTGDARLVSIDLVSNDVRTLAEVPAFARDFVIDDGALYFVDRHPLETSTWQVLRASLDRASEPEVLFESSSMLLVPSPLGGGELAIHDAGATRVLGDDGSALTLPRDGVLRVLGAAESGARAGLITAPGRIGTPVLLEGHAIAMLPSPANTHITVAGFADARAVMP
ncbi:MAG: hypothetical protein U0271_04495 [Polyangiaceae bacterium]